MIQIAALPATALPTLADPSAEMGADPTISGEFAAILAMQAGAQNAMPEAKGQNFAQQAAKPLSLTGNPGGKILPVPEMPAEPVDSLAIALPASVPLAEETAADLPEVVPPMLTAPYLPLLAPVVPVIPTVAQQDEAKPLQPAAAQAPALQQFVAGEVTPLGSQAKRPEVLAASNGKSGSAITLPAAMPTIVIEPATATSTFTPAAIEVSLPLPGLVATEGKLPVDAQTGTARRIALLASAPASSPPVPGGDSAAPAQTAVPPLASLKQEIGQQLTGEQSPAAPRASNDADIPLAANEANMASAPDAPQPMTAAPQDRASQSPSATIPATANQRAETPADFATLVDRLMAAREAAQGPLGAQAVMAAVAHAEFGKVSLRFEQQDGALNVAMASADPDFARSVLAAAPQQEAGNSDTRGQTSRQESSQSMTQPQSQSQGQQSQANDHAPQRSQSAQPQFQQQRQASDADSHSQAPRQRGIFA